MSTSFQLPGARQSVFDVDENNTYQFTRPWFLFFQGLFRRTGGVSASNNNDLEALIESTAADIEQAPADGSAALSMRMDQIERDQALRAQVGHLREQVADLNQRLNSMAQGSFV